MTITTVARLTVGFYRNHNSAMTVTVDLMRMITRIIRVKDDDALRVIVRIVLTAIPLVVPRRTAQHVVEISTATIATNTICIAIHLSTNLYVIVSRNVSSAIRSSRSRKRK